jgi:CBS domain-containing protein
MNRRDAYFDAMLRHLGAAYYESLHGRASAADVARAVGTVEEHVDEPPSDPPAAHRSPAAPEVTGGGPAHRGRWHRRVRDVMTTSVVTVDRITPHKEIAALLAEHEVSALPVLMMGRKVAGVVSEADLLTVEEKRAARAKPGVLHHPAVRKHDGSTAGELMTSPAITIHPDATIPAAARLMNRHHLKRLPVVDPSGTLIGIVSRRDLLSVFLRPDEDIAEDVRAILAEMLFADPDTVTVGVRDGIVTLSGQPAEQDQRDVIPAAIRLTWDVDGVVDVVKKFTAAAGD